MEKRRNKAEVQKWKERVENVAKIGGMVAQSAAGHADRFDEKALMLALAIGNATLSGKSGEFIQDTMADALRQSHAEGRREAFADVIFWHESKRASWIKSQSESGDLIDFKKYGFKCDNDANIFVRTALADTPPSKVKLGPGVYEVVKLHQQLAEPSEIEKAKDLPKPYSYETKKLDHAEGCPAREGKPVCKCSPGRYA